MRSWMEREGGFQEEGVFRLAGNQRTMEELESRLCPAGNDIETLMKETDGTVHDVATIMKVFRGGKALQCLLTSSQSYAEIL